MWIFEDLPSQSCCYPFSGLSGRGEGLKECWSNYCIVDINAQVPPASQMPAKWSRWAGIKPKKKNHAKLCGGFTIKMMKGAFSEHRCIIVGCDIEMILHYIFLCVCKWPAKFQLAFKLMVTVQFCLCVNVVFSVFHWRKRLYAEGCRPQGLWLWCSKLLSGLVWACALLITLLYPYMFQIITSLLYDDRKLTTIFIHVFSPFWFLLFFKKTDNTGN